MTTNVERELGGIAVILAQIQKEMAEGRASQAVLTTKLDAALHVIESLQQDMATVKPVAEEFNRWRLIGLGAVMGVGAIGTVLGLTLATAREVFFKWVGWD